jgi:hypothetical protein
MSKIPITIVENHGGKSADLKQGIAHSFAYSRHIDFRKNPTGLSLLAATRKESGTVVNALLTEMLQLPSGKMVGITATPPLDTDSEGGIVYTRATDGTWSAITGFGSQFSSTGAGMIYNRQQDTIYVPGDRSIGAIQNADSRFTGGVPTVDNLAFQNSLDQSATDSTNTYTTSTTISEADVDRLEFIPTIEPTSLLKLWVTTPGSGYITVTMHDAANNNLGSVDVGGMTGGALNSFNFSPPIRTTVRPNASTYHFHVTHGGGTAHAVGCGTLNDLRTARFETWVDALVQTSNGLHPVGEFLNKAIIGNGRYLAVWEITSQPRSAVANSQPLNTEYLRHRVVFEPNYEVTSGDVWNEYWAAACQDLLGQRGRIFLWDGYSDGWSTFIDVPEGVPYSLFSQGGILYYYAGGGWWAWAAGRPVKLTQMPNTDTEFSGVNPVIVNYPHMMASRNDILLGGFPGSSTSSSIERGVYSYGSRDKNYDPSFGYSYSISTGTRTSTGVKIGMVKSFGPQLFVSWKDGTDNYGVDVVDANSSPFTTGVWESLVMDLGRPDKEKEAVDYKVEFETLPTGATVTPKYKINRATDWTLGTPAIAGATEAKISINNRFKEIQLGIDITAAATTPQIISNTLIVETLIAEQD